MPLLEQDRSNGALCEARAAASEMMDAASSSSRQVFGCSNTAEPQKIKINHPHTLVDCDVAATLFCYTVWPLFPQKNFVPLQEFCSDQLFKLPTSTLLSFLTAAPGGADGQWTHGCFTKLPKFGSCFVHEC
jgi:hypothetical protein